MQTSISLLHTQVKIEAGCRRDPANPNWDPTIPTRDPMWDPAQHAGLTHPTQDLRWDLYFPPGIPKGIQPSHLGSYFPPRILGRSDNSCLVTLTKSTHISHAGSHVGFSWNHASNQGFSSKS